MKPRARLTRQKCREIAGARRQRSDGRRYRVIAGRFSPCRAGWLARGRGIHRRARALMSPDQAHQEEEMKMASSARAMTCMCRYCSIAIFKREIAGIGVLCKRRAEMPRNITGRRAPENEWHRPVRRYQMRPRPKINFGANGMKLGVWRRGMAINI